MRLERYIQVKKMLFIRAILALANDALSRVIFCERATDYFRNERGFGDVQQFSVVHDLLNIAYLFNMSEVVRNMVERDHMYSKDKWKNMVWTRAWDLEDVFWQVEFRTRGNLDLISRVSNNCKYLTWWYPSDKYPQTMSLCEVMAKFVCHASLLKADDVRFKNLNRSSRFCSHCDLSEEDNIGHLVLHCPHFQSQRNAMFEEIQAIRGNDESIFQNGRCDILGILLGKSVETISTVQMDEVWLTAARHITTMYNLSLRLRKGVG